jgi:hypothetical protein
MNGGEWGLTVVWQSVLVCTPSMYYSSTYYVINVTVNTSQFVLLYFLIGPNL